MTIEMFSRHETLLFGIAMVAFVVAVIGLYFLIEAVAKFLEIKHQRNMDERKIHRRYEVDRNEFAELGNAAIRNQKMQSFIAETASGRTVEVTVDDILQEVKERKNG